MPAISIRNVLIALVALLGMSSALLSFNALLASHRASRTAETVARYAVVDRNLFLSLAQMRLEGSYAISALVPEPSANRRHREISLGARPLLDGGLKIALAHLSTMDNQKLAAMGAEIGSLAAEWRQFRPTIDAAFDRGAGQRDPALRKRLGELRDRILTLVQSASAAVDAEIQSLDPSLGVLLNARESAWQARTTSGRFGFIMNMLLAADRSATQTEVFEIYKSDAQSELAWGTLGRMIAGSGDKALQETLTRGNAMYFTGSFATMRRDGIQAYSEGGKPPFTAAAWDEGLYAGQNSIVDMGLAIMDAVVVQAKEQSAAADRTLLVFSVIAGLAVALALSAILVVQFRVVRGILALSTAMLRLSKGALDTTIPGAARKDEIGTMAGAVQVFKDNLIRTRQLEEEAAQARLTAEEQRKAGMLQMADAFERSVGEIVGMVSSSATQLQATASAMTATATETAAQSIAVAGAAQEAASNVQTVAAAAEELGSSVHEIGRQVDSSAELARNAVSEADRAAERVQALNGAVVQIGEVVGLISTIADQTNLLALNATIEAARAGNAGRGFAVVAAEVKQLASQTTRATGQIAAQIEHIQASTGLAVSAIGEITGRIRQISGVAGAIAAAVVQQGAATQEIARNVAQAASGTGEVTSNVVGVADAAEETGAAASQVLGAASELSCQSEHLSAEVSRFLASVRAA